MSALQNIPEDVDFERGFQLEGLAIHPSTGEVIGPGGAEKLDPKVMGVLVLLARHAGHVVSRDDLVTQLWPNAVVTDDALTRCVYELRRQLSQAGGSERYRALLETLPKRGYRLNGARSPLPPRRDEVSPTAPSRRRWVPVSAALAVAALVAIALVFVFVQRGPEPRREARPVAATPPSTSIVVLPFVDMSPGRDQGYLADGLAEEILNLLARIPELRVISRNSAFVYKQSNVGIARIAEQLKVSHVLEGSVRKSGDRIRITTQLIDARSDSHLWSQTYDRTLDDVFAVEDDIATQVVTRLKLELVGPVPKARRADPRAYLSYVQARQLLDQAGDAATIYGRLQSALAIDPAYAQAWTGLYWLYFLCEDINSSAELEKLPQQRRDPFCARLSTADTERLGNAALTRALALDPDNATAIAYQGMAAGLRGDFRSAAAAYERATKLEPTNVDVWRPIMYFTQFIRRPDLTIRIGEYVAERDPACSGCLDQLARAYESTGRLEEAEATIRADTHSPHILARILLERGEPQAALEVVKAPGFIEVEHHDRAWALHLESMALHSLGRSREAAAALASLEAEFGARYALLIAATYAWNGNLAAAADWLERYFDTAQGEPDYGQLLNPILQPVLRNPRINARLQQHGLAPEQLAQINFEPTLPRDR